MKAAETPDLPIRWIRGMRLYGFRLFWLNAVFRALVSADIVVMPLHPRVINSWIVTLVRRLLGRKTILWGHGWSRGGPGSFGDRIRGVLRRLPHGLVVYTDAERDFVNSILPQKKTFATRNALYLRHQMQPCKATKEPCDIIYVGRLVPSKKPMLLIEAFASAIDSLPDQSMLQLVGEGPLLADCKCLADRLGILNRVVVHGHQTDLALLRELYANSVCSASPGYLGLSLTQSLGFGVPMIVARDEPHSPEIEALREGENAFFFDSNDRESMARRIVDLVSNRHYWIQQRESIAASCRRRYSVESMVSAVLAAIGEQY